MGARDRHGPDAPWRDPSAAAAPDASGFRVIGKPSRKIDGLAKATGALPYVDDIALPGMLHAKFVRSTRMHARIVNIDARAALALPGVHAVLTGKDLPIPYGVIPWTQDEHALALHKVRFIGDEVAAVAAIDEETAQRAVALVKVEYEGLPHYLEPEAALAHDAEPIHQAAEKPPKDDGTPRADGKEARKPRPNVSKHVRLEFGGFPRRGPLQPAADRHAEVERVLAVDRLGMGQQALQSRDHLGTRADPRQTDAVDEAQASVGLRAQLILLERTRFQAGRRNLFPHAHSLTADRSRVGEVIRRGDAIAEKIERPVQCEPIQVLGRGPIVQPAHRGAPAVECLGMSKTSQRTHKQMAVRRNETRCDKLTAGVDHPLSGKRSGSVARGDRRDATLVANPHVSEISLLIAGLLRDQKSILDQQSLGACGQAGSEQKQRSQLRPEGAPVAHF